MKNNHLHGLFVHTIIYYNEHPKRIFAVLRRENKYTDFVIEELKKDLTLMPHQPSALYDGIYDTGHEAVKAIELYLEGKRL